MVLQSVIFGVLAALGWGVADFIAAVVAKRVGVFWTVLGVHIASVAAASFYLIFAIEISKLTSSQWATLAVLAAVALVTYFSFYKALQLGPVAIVSPIVSAYAVVVILLATFFAGERLNLWQSVGVAASIGGVVFASLNLRGLVSLRGLVGKGVLLGLVGMLGIGIWQFSIGVISRDLGWFLPIYISRVLTLFFLVPLSTFSGAWRLRTMTLPLALGVSAAGVFDMGGLFAFARGAEIGIIAIVAGASTIYPILPMIGGLVIFKERLSANQYVGLTVALAGLSLLALST